ncbi:hypothetical protein BCR36DRAFT_417193 [Piromyces finnis]|uniref:Late embryogenesis abundant protein LEA-2 subgroup domain-containing protein n=1 Tax=Piromyces finnis TaxID=1754191 RepID=A0A1Y1UAY7_9FUNG|nr:hypothetical protein BCR36DRAFT_417193 [Piromyces finnis]|eukprot:ORX35198.1 hypothetical protein BCR36DRAFT_417193 [Piromyces finnis]
MENNNNNIGFIGSEGTNQYSNPYQSDLYSQPSIKRKAKEIAEENKRASQQYLNHSPKISAEAINQNDITNLNSIIDSNHSIAAEPIESNNPPVVNKPKNIKKSNKMGHDENKSSKAFLLADGATTIPIHDDEEKSMKPPRKSTVCCLCCPLWLCVSITVAILIFIGVMVLIFWPKIPNVDIAEIQLSSVKEGKSPIRYEIPSAINENKGGVEIDLDINVNVKNDNFYNLYVHSLDTRIFLQTANLEKTLVGKGGQKDLKFENHSTTKFTLPVTIGYYVNDVLKDKALTYLLKACSYQETIEIQYEVDIGIYIIDLVYSPTYKGRVSFQCPRSDLQDGSLENVLMGDIYSSINDYFSNFAGI